MTGYEEQEVESTSDVKIRRNVYFRVRVQTFFPQNVQKKKSSFYVVFLLIKRKLGKQIFIAVKVSLFSISFFY